MHGVICRQNCDPSKSKSNVYVCLYSALRKAPVMRSDIDHTVLPANYTMPAFTPQPQSITTLWLVLIYCPTEGRRLSRPEHFETMH